MTEEKEPRVEQKEEEEEKSAFAPLMIFLFLLVVLGGALYYFMGLPTPSGERAVQKAVERQPIKMLVKAVPFGKEEVPSVSEAEPSAPLQEEEKVEEVVVDEKPVAEIPATGSEEIVAVAEEKVPAAPLGEYALQAGAYIFGSNLAEAEKLVRQLGYEPHIRNVEKTVEMVRLRLGDFYPSRAKKKLEELSSVAPGAFCLQENSKLVVYAGSFFNAQNAQRLADKLNSQGIWADQERVNVKTSLRVLIFGSFPDRAAARDALAKATGVGLESIIVKLP